MKYLVALAILFFALSASAHESPYRMETMKNWRGKTQAWVFYCHIHGLKNSVNDLGHCVSTPDAKACPPPYATDKDEAKVIAEKECEKADK